MYQSIINIDEKYQLMQIDEVCERFEVDPIEGLNYSQVKQRFEKYGANKFSQKERNVWKKIQKSLMKPVIFCGMLLPSIFCIIILILYPNIYILTLAIVFTLHTIIATAWFSYGQRKILSQYLNIDEPRYCQVLRNCKHETLIQGYYRESLTQTPITDIIVLVLEYYRM